MRSDKASQFVEGYLYGARGHRALEQSVFAEGERRGFSERKLRRAAASLGIDVLAGCWTLPAARVEALDTSSLLSVSGEPQTASPYAMAGASGRRHAA